MKITRRTWTFTGLVLAFAHLVVSYFLLCIATLAFLFTKGLSFVKLSTPCPCTGFFGYQNSKLCFHELLFEWPVNKITSVMGLVMSRFPFDQSCNLKGENIRVRKCEESEREACSGLFSGARLDDRIDGKTKCDAKGRKNPNQKQKCGTRRRRRASVDYGKLSSDSSSIGRSGISAPRPPLHGNDTDDGMFPNGIDCGERIGNFTSRKDENPINLLEHALEEERCARLDLCEELEKERAAAASAADEAMSMIVRLQDEKSVVEMEVKQYQRMIDEKLNYDEEERNILKEILIRKEKENHFLQKELEAYRQELEDNQGEDFSENVNGSGEIPLPSFDSNSQRIGDSENVSSTEDIHASFQETEPSSVYDVHVICDKTIIWKEDDRKESGALDSSVWSGNQLSDGQSTRLTDVKPSQESHMGTSSRMSVSDNSSCSRTLNIDTQRNPPPAADNERLKLDNEIGWLRERLRIVQEGKEKLPFPTGQMEKVNAQLKVVEDIMEQLRAIQRLREPLRLASLPPAYPKVHSKRRRSQSACMDERHILSVSPETFYSCA